MKTLILFFLLFLVIFTESKYQCKNLQGKSVDWFVVYKLPKLSGSTNGKNFVYFDSEQTAWQSGNDINDPKSGVGATISQIYYSKKDDFHIMYSDDDPIGGPDSYRGHAKGVSLFDSTTGFWIIHSVPNFPSSKSYAYPTTAEKYGQSFLCVSMEVSHLSTLADHWRYIQASPYSSNAPDKFLTRFPTLKNVIAKQSLPRSATQFWTSKTIKTINGHTLMSYAKHRKFNGDIWNDIISKENGITLAVESWLNGNADDLHTTCTKTSQTHDIIEMRVMGENFKSSKDHSKFAVSSSNNNPIVCFGDLNRQKSQLSRGGGALCLQHRNLWEIYHNSVVQVEPCKGSTHFSFETILLALFVIFSI
ncbi:unnamed protein product [Caenorhabditis angaria]|uniref:Uncharacterized protein n=1 Tax=Caenorhabditis angaria TaxID=860376 RepID=A0A9P1IK11_9PELO|nr:unnamed protein product [Caenorhabditis angaria]